MRYYEITLRVSEDIVIEHSGVREGDPITGAHVIALTEDLAEQAKNVTGRFGDETVAEFVTASGPKRERGGTITGVHGPMASVDRLQRRVSEVLAELQTAEHEADRFVNQTMHNAPRCWDGDESMEWLALKYIRHLEAEAVHGNMPGPRVRHTETCDGECES